VQCEKWICDYHDFKKIYNVTYFRNVRILAVALLIITIFSLQICRADDIESVSVAVKPVQPSGDVHELSESTVKKVWIDEDAFEIEILHLLQIAISSTLLGFYIIKKRKLDSIHYIPKIKYNLSYSH